MTSIGIGIIGPGAIADVHAQALASLSATIVAAAGPEPTDLADFVSKHSVPNAYTHHDELLADSAVDAVIISAPSAVHAELSELALLAGKPVLCEVPVALSVEDARRVTVAAKSIGLPFGVAHTLRYWEPHRRLIAELLASGEPARHVLVRSLMLRQSDVGWTGKQRTWTDSAVWHHGSHAVDAAIWLLGDVSVESHTALGPAWRNGEVMDAAFTLRTEDGRIATVDLSYHARRSKADFLVVTERDTFEIQGGSLWRNDELLFEAPVETVQAAAVLAQDAAFLAAVMGDPSDFYGASDALPALAVLGL